MKKSTRRLVIGIALAALGALLWLYYRRKKQRARQVAAPAVPTVVPLVLAPKGSEPLAESAPPVHVTDEVEALARVMASESSDVAAQIRIGWVARNRANARADQSIAKMVCAPCGKQVGNTRPFSSARPATLRTRQLAKAILAQPMSDDPTHGATHILEPSLMDRLFAAGRAKWDAKGVRQRWLRGLDFYGSAEGWDFFGPKGGRGRQAVPVAWFGKEPAVA